MIKRSITFDLEKRKKDGVLIVKNVPIRCCITFNRQRITMFTGHRIDADKFIQVKGMVKNGCYNEMGFSSSEINYDIEEMRSTLQEIFREFEIANEMPTTDQIKEKYKIATGKQQALEGKAGFFDRYKEFIDTIGRQNAWSDRSFYKHNSVMHLLQQYNPDLEFDNLDEEELQNILEFMRVEKNIRNTTLNKYLRFIKQFLSWAELKGYLTNVAYKRYKPKLKGANFELKKVIYLTWEELIKLYTMEIPNSRLEQTRDVFCFCCFTGLRYSDVYNLKKIDIKDAKLNIITIKDVDNISIELNKYSRAILEKYKDVEFKKGKALPVLSNQKYNDNLKELGQLAELNEEITEVWYVGNKRMERVVKKYEVLTTHVARKTFVVNALTMGIPPQVIMRWTGHNDIKAMKPYTKIVDKLKEQEMKKFDEM